MNWTWLLLGVLGIVLAVVGFVLVKYVRIILNIFLDVLTVSPPRPHKLDGEGVAFRSLDGLALNGVFLPATRRPRGTIVFCHEFGANAASAADFAMFLRERFNLFTFDFRAHGRSTTPRGYRPHQWPTTHEVRDVLGAVAYVRSRPGGADLPVGLFGISRGGAAAICAAARAPHVRAVAADGAFATRLLLQTYMIRWIGVYSNLRFIYTRLPNWVYTGVRQMAMLVAFIRLGRRFPSVRRAIRRLSPKAVMLVHGARDTYVRKEHAEVLYDLAREPKRLWMVPGARHNQSAATAPDEYRARVTAFFTTYLAPEPAGAPSTAAVRPAADAPPA